MASAKVESEDDFINCFSSKDNIKFLSTPSALDCVCPKVGRGLRNEKVGFRFLLSSFLGLMAKPTTM